MSLKFDHLFPAYSSMQELPPIQSFQARDGARLGYRRYPGGGSGIDVVLIHGASSHSLYLCSFARALSAAGPNVYTPDLRGHGPSPIRRGDIDYIEQLEDDLADLIAHLAAENGGGRTVVVAGHSSGGGLAVRFAGGRHAHLASAYLLLAPYLGYNAPTVRHGSGGFAEASLTKIIYLAILNGFGIRVFNGARVLRFNLPEPYRDGTETLAYSYRLMTGINPRNYKTDLSAIKVPLLVLIGSEDEAFHASAFEPAITALVRGATIKLIDGASHLGLVTSPAAIAAAGWLRTLQ